MFPRTYFAGTFFAPTYFPGEAQSQAAGVTTYLFTGPTAGAINTALGPYTVTLVSAVASPVVITPSVAAQTSSVFNPTTVTLGTAFGASGTFTWTARNTGTFTIVTTNNGGLTDPAGITVTIVSGGGTSRFLTILGVG